MFGRPAVGQLRISLALAVCGALLLTPLHASAQQTLTVSAGAESSGGDVQLNEFAPGQIAIGVGDTVTWKLNSTEFHNVMFIGDAPAPGFIMPGPDGVFINPAVAVAVGGTSYDGTGVVGSGLLNKGDSYNLTFSKAGSYTYLCAIHPGMGGVVKVGDSPAADTQATLDARATAQINASLATRALPAIMANVGELATDTAAVGVAAGVQNAQADSQRFFPPRVTVRQGEAVTWIWKTIDTPHTVTFLGGTAGPDLTLPQPQAGGPPRLQLNPLVLAPAGDATNWSGSGYLNSGFLQPMPNQPAPTFTVRFAVAGTYDYLCVLHDRMVGTVVVEPTQ